MSKCEDLRLSHSTEVKCEWKGKSRTPAAALRSLFSGKVCVCLSLWPPAPDVYFTLRRTEDIFTRGFRNIYIYLKKKNNVVIFIYLYFVLLSILFFFLFFKKKVFIYFVYFYLFTFLLFISLISIFPFSFISFVYFYFFFFL